MLEEEAYKRGLKEGAGQLRFIASIDPTSVTKAQLIKKIADAAQALLVKAG